MPDMTHKTIKVYGGCYDGRWRLIVAATTKRKAWRLVRACVADTLGYRRWDTYTSITGNPTELEHALGMPGVVFRQDIRGRWDQPFETAQK